VTRILWAFVGVGDLLADQVGYIGRNIRGISKGKGIPLSQLADTAGLSEGTLYSILGGHVDPRLSSLVALAYALEVDLVDLLKPSKSRGR
jgi:transcriptional regulator with XRE-family HTH domain